MARILHALCLEKVGGVEAVFDAYLCHALSRRHEHHVLLLNGPAHPHYAANLERHAASFRSARTWRGLPVPKFARAWRARRYAAGVRPEIIVIYNTLLRRIAWQLRSSRRARLIYYERGTAWMRDEPREAIRRNLESTDRILCNSRAAARVLELKFGLAPGHCHVVYNPLRLAAVDVPRRTADAGLRVGMVGRMVASKGMVSGIHAARLLQTRGAPVQWLIAGTGPEQSALREAARKLGLGDDRVTFCGTVQDMAGFYGGIDVLLCPSIRESLGNVAVEASAAGCPVICTAVDGLPEVVLHGITGFCLEPTLTCDEYLRLGVASRKLPAVVYDPIHDALLPPRGLAPEAIAASVETFLREPSLLRSMGRAAREHAWSRFGMDRYMAELDAELVTP